MSLKMLALFLAVVHAVLLVPRASAQSGSCMSALVSLSPCLNYITGNMSTPSSSCCSQLATVVQAEPQCLCLVLNGSASSLGITVNQTRALGLPAACKVQTPPISKCNGKNTREHFELNTSAKSLYYPNIALSQYLDNTSCFKKNIILIKFWYEYFNSKWCTQCCSYHIIPKHPIFTLNFGAGGSKTVPAISESARIALQTPAPFIFSLLFAAAFASSAF